MARRKIDLSAPAPGAVVDMASGKVLEKDGLPLLCERIRYYRELRGMEQKAFAAGIGVSANAANNWEKGRSRPDVNLLPAICRALGITLYDLYGESAPGADFSERERQLIDGYRRLTPGNRYAVEQAVETLGLVQTVESRPELRELLYFERALAAGAADPTEFEQDARPIWLYDAPAVRRADYVFPVNGDSMEPDYHSGDLALVEKLGGGARLRYGETGAFIVGNETYIKQYEADGLHSLNPKYAPLRFDEEQAVYLIGRVVGVASRQALPSEAELEAYLTVHRAIR